MEETKTCTKCGETKPITVEFWYFSRGKPQAHCRECRRVAERTKYLADPAGSAAKRKRQRQANAEAAKQYASDYYWTNRERKLEIQHASMERHRDRIRARDRARGRPTRENNRRILQEWYGQGCIICGLVFLPGGMQAHHRNEQEKDLAASQLLNARRGTLVDELAKCDPFCASHHYLLTQAKREGWEGKPYEELLDKLREQWQETMRTAGLRYDTPTGGPPSQPRVDLATIDPPPAADAAPSWAKLTWEQMREIRRRHAAGGVTQRSLCKEYGVTPATMCRLLQGKTWREPAD